MPPLVERSKPGGPDRGRAALTLVPPLPAAPPSEGLRPAPPEEAPPDLRHSAPLEEPWDHPALGLLPALHSLPEPDVPLAPDPVPVLEAEPRADDDPGPLCAALALCVVEIIAGARPLEQLNRWVTNSVFVHLLHRTVIAARARAVSATEAMRPRVRVGDPVISRPHQDAVESVVMVHQPARSRAVAIRLERHRDRWRATAITVL